MVQKKKLVTRVSDYQLIVWQLYKLGANGILQCCILEHERYDILQEEHEGFIGGHYVGKETTQNVLCAWL